MTEIQDRETETQKPIKCRCSSRLLMRGGAVLVILLATGYMTMPHWLGYLMGSSDNSSAIGDEMKLDLSNISQTDDSRLQLLGNWKMTSENGLRSMVLHEDGSGLLIYKPTSFTHKMALGNRIEVDLTWVKSGDYVAFESVRGRPAGAFKTAIAIEGKYKKRRLESIDAEKMVLINELVNENDKENSPKTIWYRVKN